MQTVNRTLPIIHSTLFLCSLLGPHTDGVAAQGSEGGGQLGHRLLYDSLSGGGSGAAACGAGGRWWWLGKVLKLWEYWKLSSIKFYPSPALHNGIDLRIKGCFGPPPLLPHLTVIHTNLLFLKLCGCVVVVMVMGLVVVLELMVVYQTVDNDQVELFVTSICLLFADHLARAGLHQLLPQSTPLCQNVK